MARSLMQDFKLRWMTVLSLKINGWSDPGASLPISSDHEGFSPRSLTEYSIDSFDL